MSDKSWKPRRRGKLYCSPACGCGCTYADYLKAHRDGKRLAATLNGTGRGWKVEVWENGGWHFKIVKGDCEIRENSPTSYWCNFRPGGDDMIVQIHATGKTPYASLKKVFEAVQAITASMQFVMWGPKRKGGGGIG